MIWGGSNEKAIGNHSRNFRNIGGADGPTSIFIAGKLNGDNFIFMIVVGIILLILAGVIFYKRKH